MNILSIGVNVTPQQQLAFAYRDFPLPEVMILPNGDCVAFTVKPAKIGFEWAEQLARSPEVAVNMLAQDLVRQ